MIITISSILEINQNGPWWRYVCIHKLVHHFGYYLLSLKISKSFYDALEIIVVSPSGCLKISFSNLQTRFLGLCGEKVDAINHQTAEVERLSKEVTDLEWTLVTVMLIDLTESTAESTSIVLYLQLLTSYGPWCQMLLFG